MFAVVAEIFTTPPEDIEIASVSDAEPIVPASLIIISSTKVTIPVDAIVIAVAADEISGDAAAAREAGEE